MLVLRHENAPTPRSDGYTEALETLRERRGEGNLHFDVNIPSQSDTRLAAKLFEMVSLAREQGLDCHLGGLPPSQRNLLELALAVPASRESRSRPHGPISRIGEQVHAFVVEGRRVVEFTGELVLACLRFGAGKARFRKRDFWILLQACGAGALPIVSLIAVMVGIILGFVGAVQLQKFGATIYMIDLVGLAMAREMGAVMTGVILSGRTGAAFAAQLGTMNVNQETDALETLGISRMEYLVLPRVLALVLMMPLLTLYADFLGWMGAFIVAIPMNISPAEFWIQLAEAVTLKNVGLGLFKSVFFGGVVGACGCYYGLRSGRSSSAVGEAATSAVVAGITGIILLDAFFAFTFEILGW